MMSMFVRRFKMKIQQKSSIIIYVIMITVLVLCVITFGMKDVWSFLTSGPPENLTDAGSKYLSETARLLSNFPAHDRKDNIITELHSESENSLKMLLESPGVIPGGAIDLDALNMNAIFSPRVHSQTDSNSETDRGYVINSPGQTANDKVKENTLDKHLSMKMDIKTAQIETKHMDDESSNKLTTENSIHDILDDDENIDTQTQTKYPLRDYGGFREHVTDSPQAPTSYNTLTTMRYEKISVKTNNTQGFKMLNADDTRTVNIRSETTRYVHEGIINVVNNTDTITNQSRNLDMTTAGSNLNGIDKIEKVGETTKNLNGTQSDFDNLLQNETVSSHSTTIGPPLAHRQDSKPQTLRTIGAPLAHRQDSKPQTSTTIGTPLAHRQDSKPQTSTTIGPPLAHMRDSKPQTSTTIGPPLPHRQDSKPQTSTTIGALLTHRQDSKLQTLTTIGPPLAQWRDSKPQTSTTIGPPLAHRQDSKPQTSTTIGAPLTHRQDSKPQISTTIGAPLPHRQDSKPQTSTTIGAPLTHRPDSKLQTLTTIGPPLAQWRDSKAQTSTTIGPPFAHRQDSKPQTSTTIGAPLAHRQDSKPQTSTTIGAPLTHRQDSKPQTSTTIGTPLAHRQDSKLQTTTTIGAPLTRRQDSKPQTLTTIGPPLAHRRDSKLQTSTTIRPPLAHRQDSKPQTSTTIRAPLAHRQGSKLQTTTTIGAPLAHRQDSRPQTSTNPTKIILNYPTIAASSRNIYDDLNGLNNSYLSQSLKINNRIFTHLKNEILQPMISEVSTERYKKVSKTKDEIILKSKRPTRIVPKLEDKLKSLRNLTNTNKLQTEYNISTYQIHKIANSTTTNVSKQELSNPVLTKTLDRGITNRKGTSSYTINNEETNTNTRTPRHRHLEFRKRRIYQTESKGSKELQNETNQLTKKFDDNNRNSKFIKQKTSTIRKDIKTGDNKSTTSANLLTKNMINKKTSAILSVAGNDNTETNENTSSLNNAIFDNTKLTTQTTTEKLDTTDRSYKKGTEMFVNVFRPEHSKSKTFNADSLDLGHNANIENSLVNHNSTETLVDSKTPEPVVFNPSYRTLTKTSPSSTNILSNSDINVNTNRPLVTNKKLPLNESNAYMDLGSVSINISSIYTGSNSTIFIEHPRDDPKKKDLVTSTVPTPVLGIPIPFNKITEIHNNPKFVETISTQSPVSQRTSVEVTEMKAEGRILTSHSYDTSSFQNIITVNKNEAFDGLNISTEHYNENITNSVFEKDIQVSSDVIDHDQYQLKRDNIIDSETSSNWSLILNNTVVPFLTSTPSDSKVEKGQTHDPWQQWFGSLSENDTYPLLVQTTLTNTSGLSDTLDTKQIDTSTGSIDSSQALTINNEWQFVYDQTTITHDRTVADKKKSIETETEVYSNVPIVNINDISENRYTTISNAHDLETTTPEIHGGFNNLDYQHLIVKSEVLAVNNSKSLSNIIPSTTKSTKSLIDKWSDLIKQFRERNIINNSELLDFLRKTSNEPAATNIKQTQHILPIVTDTERVSKNLHPTVEWLGINNDKAKSNMNIVSMKPNHILDHQSHDHYHHHDGSTARAADLQCKTEQTYKLALDVLQTILMNMDKIKLPPPQKPHRRRYLLIPLGPDTTSNSHALPIYKHSDPDDHQPQPVPYRVRPRNPAVHMTIQSSFHK